MLTTCIDRLVIPLQYRAAKEIFVHVPAHTHHATSQMHTQFISKDGDDGSDEDEWDEWFDDFVVAAAKEEPSIPEGPEGGEDEQGQGEESEEDEEEEGQAPTEEGGHPAPSVTGSGSKAAGVRAASIASSYWRPERQDRKGELGGLDDRFEQLATQVSA